MIRLQNGPEREHSILFTFGGCRSLASRVEN